MQNKNKQVCSTQIKDVKFLTFFSLMLLILNIQYIGVFLGVRLDDRILMLTSRLNLDPFLSILEDRTSFFTRGWSEKKLYSSSHKVQPLVILLTQKHFAIYVTLFRLLNKVCIMIRINFFFGPVSTIYLPNNLMTPFVRLFSW